MGQDAECTRVALIVEDDAELRTLAAALLEETDLGLLRRPVPRRLCTI